MARLVSAVTLLIAAVVASAAPVPVLLPEPLPKGATVRLGTLSFRGPDLVGLTFSPDGKTLRAANDWKFFAWDAATGKPLLGADFTPKGVEGLRGTTTIVGNRMVWIGSKGLVRIGESGENTVVVSDLLTGEVCRFRFSGLTFPGHLESGSPVWMTKAAVSAEGKHLAVWADGDKTLRVYDLDSGKQLHSQQFDVKHAPGVHVSPDGKTIYFQEFQKPIRRCDLLSGKLLPDLGMPMQTMARIEAGPDGKRAVIRDRYVTSDKAQRYLSDPDHSKLTVWDVIDNKAAGTLSLDGTAQHFKFAGATTLLVLAAKYRPGLPTLFTLSRWNVATLKKEWEVPSPPADWLTVSGDGKRFAVTDRWHVAHVFDASTGIPDAALSGHAGAVSWIGFSPDGDTVTTADEHAIWNWNMQGNGKAVAHAQQLTRGPAPLTILGDRLVWVIPADDGNPAELVGWDQAKSAIGWRMPLAGKAPDRVYSHDGKRVVGLTWDAEKKWWDVTVYDGPVGKKLYSWSMTAISVWDWPWPVAFVGDGKSLHVGCRDGVIGHDTSTGKETSRLETAGVQGNQLSKQFPLTVSADGRRIAVVNGYPGVERWEFKVRIFDVKSGKSLVEHEIELDPENNGGVQYGVGLKFSPDAKRVAVWAGPGTKVLVCDAETEAKLRVFDGGLSRPTCVAFSPNNRYLAVGYQDGTSLIWDLAAK